MDKFISQTDSSLKKKEEKMEPKGRQVENMFLKKFQTFFVE